MKQAQRRTRLRLLPPRGRSNGCAGWQASVRGRHKMGVRLNMNRQVQWRAQGRLGRRSRQVSVWMDGEVRSVRVGCGGLVGVLN